MGVRRRRGCVARARGAPQTRNVGTGRFDRGEKIADAGAITLVDPVQQGDIETHSLYGAATPNARKRRPRSSRRARPRRNFS